MSDIRDLLPRDKLDLERAEAIVAQGYPAVAPVLPDLMVWLQDSNWPVCDIIAPFLAGLGAPVIPEVRGVLDSDDAIWKRWVLLYVVAESGEVREGVRDQLARLADAEPTEEEEEGLREIAAEILRHGATH